MKAAGQQDSSGMLGATGDVPAQASGIPLGQMAENYPISPDLEDRRGNQSTTPPPPSFMDRARAGLGTLGTKLQMTMTGLEHGGNPYWQAPVDPNFYRPGRDASSMIFRGGR